MWLGRTLLIALLLVGLCPPAAAQVFNLRVDLEGSVNNSGTAWAVEVTDDGNYLVISNGNYVSGMVSLGSMVRALVVDPNGTVMAEERVPDTLRSTYPGWSNSSDKRSDGGFVVGGNTFRTDSLGTWISRAALFMLAADGSVEGLTEVGPENQSWIGRQAKQTPDGGYVICGETSSNGGNQLDAFVIKTDALGNEEWTRTYGGAWNDYAMSVDMRQGGGYFMGGEYKASASNSQLWVQAINDTGGVVWDKKWGSAFDEPSAHITTASDGHVLVASSWAYGANFVIRRYLAKLDASDGSIIWEKQYANTALNYPVLFVVQEIEPGGDLISVSNDLIAGQHHGVLLRTTSTGDSLWMRHYQYHDSLVSNGRGILRDVVPTPDGGFVAVGSALSVPGVYTQDVWVIKVDEHGCLEPGCHLITGMETQITNLGGALKVWPNPVARGAPVQVELQLPEGFVVQGQLRLTVTDAAGRVVQEEVLGQGGHRERPGAGRDEANFTGLVRAHWPSGLYHLHLTDNSRWLAGKSFVVE